MTTPKVETIPELMARLDWLYERFSETDTDALVGHIRDDWPRISKAVTALREFVEGHIANYPNPAGPEARELLARLDAGEEP